MDMIDEGKLVRICHKRIWQNIYCYEIGHDIRFMNSTANVKYQIPGSPQIVQADLPPSISVKLALKGWTQQCAHEKPPKHFSIAFHRFILFLLYRSLV